MLTFRQALVELAAMGEVEWAVAWKRKAAKTQSQLRQNEVLMFVRTFQDRDESAVVALWREVLPDSASHNDPLTAIHKKLAVGRQLLFVAVVDGLVVGTVMGGYDGHRGWIYALAVAPAHRRLGIGRALVARLEEELAVCGCLKVNLQVRATNERVVVFYEKLGYAVEERISMGKRLYA